MKRRASEVVTTVNVCFSRQQVQDNAFFFQCHRWISYNFTFRTYIILWILVYAACEYVKQIQQTRT